MKKTPYQQMLDKQYKIRNINSFKELAGDSANIYKKRAAFILKNDKGEKYEISYKKFYEDYKAISTSLLYAGLGGKKIAVLGQNSYKWCVSYIAAATIGIVVPVDKELHPEDIANYLKTSDTTVIMGDKKLVDSVCASTNGIKAVYFEKLDGVETFDSLLVKGSHYISAGATRFDKLTIDPDETKILIFTSGTTGKAKGVCLSHRNICEDIMAVCKVVKVGSNTRVMSVLPLHHTYECSLGFLLILYRGGCITFTEGLRYVSKNISEYHPTTLIVVPLLIEKILEKVEYSVREGLPAKYRNGTEKLLFSELLTLLPFAIRKIVKRKVRSSLGDRLKLLIVGAAPISAETIKCYNMLGVRTLQGYGLTETSPLLVGNNDFFINYNSVGLPIPGVEIKISNPDPETGVGEIAARGKMVMKGYYNDPEATSEVLKDSWFYTGDLGYTDEDGYLYLTGRSKNIIVTKNGKNIYPEEIEEKLGQISVISESLISGGLDVDNDMYVKAKIFPNIDAIKDSLQGKIPTKEEVFNAVKNAVDEINDRLPSYKRIKKFIIKEDEFEKTTTKKIKRHGDNMKDD